MDEVEVIEEAIARVRAIASDEEAGRFAASVVERAYSGGGAQGQRDWPESVAKAELRPEDLEPLWAVLVETVRSDLRGANVDILVWVLGKSHEPRFRELYCEVLRASLDGEPNALYQSLIALHKLGEMPEYTGWSALDVEENRRRAAKFLGGQSGAHASERLVQAIHDCSPAAAAAALEAGADPNHVIDVPFTKELLQPDTPLKLLMFRLSDSFIDDDDRRACAAIARQLVAAGGDPAPAMALAEQNYGPYDPGATGPFAEAWHVIAQAASTETQGDG